MLYFKTGEYDIATAIIIFPSGVTARLELGRGIKYGYDMRVEVKHLNKHLNIKHIITLAY